MSRTSIGLVAETLFSLRDSTSISELRRPYPKINSRDVVALWSHVRETSYRRISTNRTHALMEAETKTSAVPTSIQ